MLNSNALRGAYFIIMKCYAPRHELQRNILRHGGRIVDSIERKVSYLITTEESVNSSRMVYEKCSRLNIYIHSLIIVIF